MFTWTCSSHGRAHGHVGVLLVIRHARVYSEALVVRSAAGGHVDEHDGRLCYRQTLPYAASSQHATGATQGPSTPTSSRLWVCHALFTEPKQQT